MARAFAIIAVLVLGAMSGPFAVPQTNVSVTIEDWPTPSSNSRPHDLVIAPDGSIWYTDYMAGLLGQFDPSTTKFRQYPLRIQRSGPHGLTFDGEGNIWFTAYLESYIGKLSPTGRIREYGLNVPTYPRKRFPLTPRFDKKGVLWFTMDEGSMAGRLNPQTEKLDFSNSPTLYSRPYDIAFNSQGIPFLAEFGSNKLATIDPSTMEVQEFDLPNSRTRPHRLTITRDDAIWYTDFSRGYLGRFDPKTKSFKEWGSPGGPRSKPYGITHVADTIWYGETGAKPNVLVRFDSRSGAFQTWEIPSCRGQIRNLVPSPDGMAIWFSCSFPGSIGRVRVSTP